MRYLAAYVLATLGGVESPSAQDLKTIITAADGEFDQSQAELVCSRLKGCDIQEIGSFAPVAAATTCAAQVAAPAAQAAKVEAKAEEPEESEEEMGLASMFD